MIPVSDSTTPCSTCATPQVGRLVPGGVRHRDRRPDPRHGGVPPGAGTDNHHDLGLFSVGPDARRPRAGPGRAVPPGVGGRHDPRPGRPRATHLAERRRARRRERPRREQVDLRQGPRRQRVRDHVERAARAVGPTTRHRRDRRSRSTSTPSWLDTGARACSVGFAGMPQPRLVRTRRPSSPRTARTSPRPPLAITFSDDAARGRRAVRRADARRHWPTAAPAASPAGCVFWMKAAERTFSTVAEDHGNCSVGSVTHGFKTLDEVAGNSDVAALLDTGWVTMDVVPQIPVVHEKPGAVTYGPLAETPGRPRRRVPARQRPPADGAVGRDPGPAHRGQAAVPHRRDRQGGGRARRERGMRAQPRAHRHAADRDDVRDPGVAAAPSIVALASQQHTRPPTARVGAATPPTTRAASDA